MNNKILEELELNIKVLSAQLLKLQLFKEQITSGEYEFECSKAYDGWHQWRTTKTEEGSNRIGKCLPYCYYCGEVDETNTQKDTPIVGDRNWHDRGLGFNKIP